MHPNPELTREQIEFMKQFSASDNHRKLCDMALRALLDTAGDESGRWVAGRQREICTRDLRNLAKHAESEMERATLEYAADMISKSTLYAAPAALPEGAVGMLAQLSALAEYEQEGLPGPAEVYSGMGGFRCVSVEDYNILRAYADKVTVKLAAAQGE